MKKKFGTIQTVLSSFTCNYHYQLYLLYLIFCYMQKLYFITCRHNISLHADVIFHVIFHYMQTLYFITCRRYISRYISLHADVKFHVIFHYMQTYISHYISLHADVKFHYMLTLYFIYMQTLYFTLHFITCRR